MRKHLEPIVLTIALVILIATAAGLALTFPSVQDITNVASTSPSGKTPPKLKAEELQQRLAAWTTPAIWNVPADKHRLFLSDRFLFYASAYPNGKYIVKDDGTARTPSGVLITWYQKYTIDFTDPNVDRGDPDNDGFSNITEFKNGAAKATDVDGSQSTNPTDPASHPSFLSRLRLQKYDSRPFRMTFRGLEQLGGVNQYQIVLADVPSYQQPKLKKTGDSLGFEGYVVGPYTENIVSKEDPNTHIQVQENDSTLELDKPDIGFKILLPYRKEIDSPESTANFAMLMPTERDKVLKVPRGQVFVLPLTHDSYLMISADEKGAVIQDLKAKKDIIVPLLVPADWDEVPLPPAKP